VDVSPGGIGVRCDWQAEPSTPTGIVLPGTEGQATARVVRSAGGLLGLAFRQDPATPALVDQALRNIGAHSRAAA
jgi:hypothetical protein